MKKINSIQNQEENVTTTPHFPSDADLAEVIDLTVTKTLRELGLRGGIPKRVRRADMVNRIGRKRFDRAVQNGELKVHKNGPEKQHGVWAKKEDWERFTKKFYL